VVRSGRRLGGRLLVAALAGPALATFAAATAGALGWGPGLVLAVGLGGGGALAAFAIAGSIGRVRRTLSALEDGVRSFRDADYSLRLAEGRDDELGALVQIYNDLGDALRAQRRDIVQRELLLDTLLHGVPVATVLVAASGRVVFSNRAARHLLHGGRRLEGHRFADIVARAPAELGHALAAERDALFSVDVQGGHETYKAGRRGFQLGGQDHTLYMLERLTQELRRREVDAWRNAVRVVNHELNNSLAPIRSLAHSARRALDRPEHRHRLEEMLDTVEERVGHLAAFLEGYAAFARVPVPRKQPVMWGDLLDRVRRLVPFAVEGPLPDGPALLDPSLMEQVLINLIKNASESGSPAQAIAVSVRLAADGGSVLRVMDAGPGMDDEELRRALVPFYTSKPGGTGLGLPLSNEIVEAHGGRLQLENRDGGGLVVTCRLPPG
jgi:two-component system, NtrC family, nitrogen regulation sensor histidine kinase NtrY